MIGSCLPNLYGTVGSLESSLIVKVWGSGDAIEETEGNPAVCVGDSYVEFRIFGELFRCGLGSLEICSTKNTSESAESIEVLDVMLSWINEIE